MSDYFYVGCNLGLLQ